VDVDAGTAVAFVAAIVAYIELRVRSSVEHALRPLPKRSDDVVVPAELGDDE
jgi:hypothetical protein